MKKELFAVLLLVLLFAASLINISCICRLTDELTESVERCAAAASDGDWSAAEGHVRAAVTRWEECDSYTHIVLRHSEVDIVSDSLFELLEQVCSQEPGGVTGASESAAYHLDSISSMERLRLGSIF